MCPFRVLVIMFSLLIALCATMAALAEDPREEDERLSASSSSDVTAAERFAAKSTSAKVWYYFVDFWSGRYLYRESKRLMPFLFAKDEPDTIDEHERDSSSNDSSELADSAEASAPEEELPEPSAPAADAEPMLDGGAASKHSSSVADAAFDHALKRRQHLSHEMGVVGAVIS